MKYSKVPDQTVHLHWTFLVCIYPKENFSHVTGQFECHHEKKALIYEQGVQDQPAHPELMY